MAKRKNLSIEDLKLLQQSKDEGLFFSPLSPFYNMVTTFQTSLSMIGLVLSEKTTFEVSEKDYLVIEGNHVAGRHFFPYEVFQSLSAGFFNYKTYIKSSCCMFANTAYETVKNHNDNSPEFEFFRHIRNASSHENKFIFFNKEPKRPAQWAKVTIDDNKKGEENPLYGKECFGSFFGPGDILELVKDIELKIIKKTG